MDKGTVRDEFAAYVAAYDPHNPRIALKVAHTYRVAELCERIARSTGVNADLAWLCGMLHDIGRFEQVRRFDTFNDAASVSHAGLGVDVLFNGINQAPPLIERFCSRKSWLEPLRLAIATHSDYELPASLDDDTRALCNVLRDADKIDILKVNCICPIEDIYGVSQDEMDRSEVSPEVVKPFYEHRTIPRSIRRYPADILIGHICFAWELVYPMSIRIMREQGYLEQMLGRRFVNERTQTAFDEMSHHLRACLLT